MKQVEKRGLPLVSVVVCTYNRKSLLRRCLSSIYAQDYPKSNLEVIVVDGGSTDGTKEICKEYPKIRFTTESKFGLAYARNKGAELAKGSIVAYTDDDCIVDKHWLKNLVLGFRTFPSIAGVGGPVCPAYPGTIPQKILVKPALGLFGEGENMKLVQGIITSNAAFKREIFAAMKFDETLGITRRGKLVLSGEDVDFCQTIAKSGYKLQYTPSARVYHQIPKDRIRVSYIVKHAVHNGISMTRFFEKEKNSRIWMIRFAVGGLVQSLLAMISDRSFTSCYKIIASTSTLFICITGLNRILLQKDSN